VIDAEATINALEARLAATPRATQPYEHATLAYRLGLAHAESPVGEAQTNLRTALRHYDIAAALFDPRFDTVEHARTRNASGAAHRALGNHDRAATDFARAASLLDGQGCDDERAAALNNLALTMADRGERSAALDHFAEAAELFDPATAQGRRGRAAAWLNRGLANAGEGTIEALHGALVDYHKAVVLVDDVESPYHFGLLEHSIGVAHTALAFVTVEDRATHLEVAVEAFNKSLTVFIRSGFPYQHALAMHNLGRALLALGGTRNLRFALACFEDTVATLDPRLHAEAWERAHASLRAAEIALRELGHNASRPEHFVALVDGSSSDERVAILRKRLSRLLSLPDKSRHAALADIARASVALPDHGLGFITAELTVLAELPNENLEATLLARLAANREMDDACREQADVALDHAVGDAFNGPQRVFVRDFLGTHGFERP